MKKLVIILSISVLFSTSFVSAQELKFGHVNLQEVIFLMSEMDSAQVVLEKYGNDLQETFVSMQNEFQSKYNNYQQMSANWAPAVLDAKTKELEEMQQRLQQFQQSAQQDIQQKQQQILAPIYKKANDAVAKVGRSNGFIYIFDISTGGIPYFDETKSSDVSVLLKNALNIPLDKKVKQQQPQQSLR
jgi:outer membrane protein